MNHLANIKYEQITKQVASNISYLIFSCVLFGGNKFQTKHVSNIYSAPGDSPNLKFIYYLFKTYASISRLCCSK